MCARIEKYRHGEAPDPLKYRIGCIMIAAW